MPMEEPPSLFGFHPNANIIKQLGETDETCFDLLKMGEIEGVKNKLKEKKKSTGNIPSRKNSVRKTTAKKVE